MAGTFGQAIAFTLLIVFVASLDPEPPEFLGPYTNESARWPFGGCAEVLKIYPAPGRKLPPPKTYEENWNVKVTVVFSRPVTRVLWPFDDRAWIQSKFLRTTKQEFERFNTRNGHSGLLRDDIPNLVRCAKWACLVAIHGEWIQFWRASVAPTNRGNIFNDEYEFSFSLSKSLEDRVSHFYFILDGGWFYAPVYKFSTRANVEYVPYTMVKYFSSSGSIFLPKTQTVQESDYFLSAQTCSAHGGLIHRPFPFRRVNHDNRNEGTPKLLPGHKIIEASEDGLLQIKKMRLYYQVRYPGQYTLHLPSSVKLTYKGKNFTVSLPFKTLNINFTVPRLYIPVDTRYIFDYRDRAYALASKWNAYFFAWSHLKDLVAQCNDSNSFECQNLKYISSFHRTHSVATRSKATSFHYINQTQVGLYPYHTAFMEYYDNHTQPYQYFKSCSRTDEWYHVFEDCVKRNGKSNIAVCTRKQTGDDSTAEIRRLIIDPHWKMVANYDNRTMMLVDLITKSTELPRTLLRSFGVKVNYLPGMMQYTRTGSLYERDWSQAIPLINFIDQFTEVTNNLFEGVETCTCHYHGFNGRWGTHKKMTELANLYRLHVPFDVRAWSVQQTPNITYMDKYGHKGSLKSDISIPDDIKKEVLKYVVLTNVEPNVHLGGDDDLPTRLKADEESYPLEKAVFLPHKLLGKYGCGQLYIRHPYDHEHDQAHEQCADQCDNVYESCSGLPFDSLERFPSMPPFNLPDLVGSTDPSNQKFKRALYYSQLNNSWNHFILYSPNSYYTASIDVEGDIKIEEPLYIEESCDEIWKFTPDKYEITKGYLTAMIANKGKGGNEISVSVSCSPKLVITPSRVTVYTKPGQTTTLKFVLGGYLLLNEPGYQCEMSIVIDTSLFPTAIGKGVITCSLLVPIVNGAFTDPCNNDTSGANDITYYVLPNDFVDQFSLQFFLSSAVGQHFMLYKVINMQLVKYHMISLSCENKDVIALPEDQLIATTSSGTTTNRTLHLIYTTDQTLHRRLYIFVRKGRYQAGTASGAAMECLLTLWSSPHRSCGIVARRYITLTEADVLLAKALEGQQAIKNDTSPKKTSFLSDLISENDEVVSAVLVCMGTSLILMMVTVSGNSMMFLYTQLSPTERKAKQIQTNLMAAKREHKKTWNNPQMYLRSGTLGPYYMLHNFKATGELDNANLKTLKVAGMLKYKEKKLQVMFGHIKKITIKQTDDSIEPEEVWLQASSGMYLLKQKHVSEEYREEFHSFFQRHTKAAPSPSDTLKQKLSSGDSLKQKLSSSDALKQKFSSSDSLKQKFSSSDSLKQRLSSSDVLQQMTNTSSHI